MVTFHPSAKRCHNGYAAMVIVRNPKGQCVGCGCGVEVFETKDAARDAARFMAHRVAARPGHDFIRVR